MLYLLPKNLIFQKSSWISGLLKILTIKVFHVVVMNIEFITCWFLDGHLTILAIQVCIVKPVMFFWLNIRILSSSLRITMILICTRFQSAMPSRISKPQTKQWMDFYSIILWSNCSLHHWCVSTIQYCGIYTVLLSLCKASTFIPASSWRSNVLKYE